MSDERSDIRADGENVGDCGARMTLREDRDTMNKGVRCHGRGRLVAYSASGSSRSKYSTLSLVHDAKIDLERMSDTGINGFGMVLVGWYAAS